MLILLIAGMGIISEEPERISGIQIETNLLTDLSQAAVVRQEKDSPLPESSRVDMRETSSPSSTNKSSLSDLRLYIEL